MCRHVNATNPERLGVLFFLNSVGPRYPNFPKDGLLTPALLSPDYVAPCKEETLEVVTYVFAPLAILIVLLRVWVSTRWPGVGFGREDVVIILAGLCMVAFGILVLYSAYAACAGYHAYDCPVAELQTLLTVSNLMYQFFIWGTFFAKLSNQLFLLRIAPKNMIKSRRTIKASIWLGIAIAVVSSILFIFPCVPLSGAWKLQNYIGVQHCANRTAIALTMNIMFVLLDLLILSLPYGIVRELNLPRRTQIAIVALWLLGLIATITCAIKIHLFAALYKTWDVSWVGADIVIWSTIELSLTTVTVSLPAIDLLLVKLVPHRLRNWLRDRDRQYESHTKSMSSDPSTVYGDGLDQDKLDFIKELDPRSRTKPMVSVHEEDVQNKRHKLTSHDIKYSGTTAVAQSRTTHSKGPYDYSPNFAKERKFDAENDSQLDEWMSNPDTTKDEPVSTDTASDSVHPYYRNFHRSQSPVTSSEERTIEPELDLNGKSFLHL